MGKEASLDVTGPASTVELAARVGLILGLPVGDPHPVDGHIFVGPAVLVRDNGQGSPIPADYCVVFYTGEDLADKQSWAVFDRLAETTGWALSLLDDGYTVVAERPSLTEVS